MGSLLPTPSLSTQNSICQDGRYQEEDAVLERRDGWALRHHTEVRGCHQGEQPVADQADCDIRDYGKKVHSFEIEFDETNDKLTKATESLEEKEKMYKEVESDVAALSRRIMLMEEEAKKSEENLAQTVTKLATTSKEADNILKKVKVFESKCMNNEVTIEEYDKNLRQTTKMASDNEQKLDELSRKLGVQEDELKRAVERAELAEAKLKGIEEELQL